VGKTEVCTATPVVKNKNYVYSPSCCKQQRSVDCCAGYHTYRDVVIDPDHFPPLFVAWIYAIVSKMRKNG